MAVLVRGCCRFSSAFSFSRVVLSCSGKTRLPLSAPARVAAAARPYSSDRDGQKKRFMLIAIPNPVEWFRTKIYYFLIRTYFDKEFTLEEFTEGAKQAFTHVSSLLSQCQFKALEGLVEKDLIGKLEEKCSLLPLSHIKALSADEIMHTTPHKIGILYDDDGRKFVSILMRFWYLTSASLPDEPMKGIPFFQLHIGEDAKAASKGLLIAHYEFQREFTKGVLPQWTITKIEHSKLLD
ncbi:hypothetical protein PAMA_003573 [Pampus argenteus]